MSFDVNGAQVDCSGVRFAPAFVLTTASCLLGSNVASVTHNGVRTSVKSIRYDPDFDMSSSSNTAEVDVAMLELSSRAGDAFLQLFSVKGVVSDTMMIRLELSVSTKIKWVEQFNPD